MSKYIKLFETHSDYNTYINSQDKVLPNVSYCENENEVHYNPLDLYNGHAYVDLGLPSGTKWATMNVGANIETEAGLFFAWGETQGYKNVEGSPSIDGEKAFTWNDYKYGTSSNLTKYNTTDGKTVLDLEDDAARVNWGGNWHMPTKEQCDELFNTEYVTNEWVTDYNSSGVKGCLFTSVKNGNTMFVPAAGLLDNGRINNVSTLCNIWASSLNSNKVSSAWEIYFASSGGGVYGEDGRYYGFSVRAVVG